MKQALTVTIKSERAVIVFLYRAYFEKGNCFPRVKPEPRNIKLEEEIRILAKALVFLSSESSLSVLMTDSEEEEITSFLIAILNDTRFVSIRGEYREARSALVTYSKRRCETISSSVLLKSDVEKILNKVREVRESH